MTRRLETKAAATRRARVEFDSYGDSILLTEVEAGAVVGLQPQHPKILAVIRVDERPGADLPERDGALSGGQHPALAQRAGDGGQRQPARAQAEDSRDRTRLTKRPPRRVIAAAGR